MIADRIKEPLLKIIRSAMRPIDYYALYRARLVAQSGNKVDLQPDDSRLPPMAGVSLRHGLPGVSVTVSPGAYLMVGWDGGDPRKPYAELWEGGETVSEIQIAGTTPVAREGDNLTASAIFKTWAGKVETVINSVAPGTFDPVTGSFASSAPGAPGAAGAFGAINQGSPTVKVA